CPATGTLAPNLIYSTKPGRIVAERMDNSDLWQLVGDYKKPLFQHCAPPWQSCQIGDYFKSYYIIAPLRSDK
ncbi:hypothetical protein QLG07_01960, partial [Erwinia sp. V90_4]|nr:hypothetical protein [Erwinia sp. V90_4]